MIYDKLINCRRYLGFHSNLDLALTYIAEHDLNKLPLGKTELKGAEVYINVMDAQAKPIKQQAYEFHKEYMDIQIDLDGTEEIRTGNFSSMKILDYQPDTDFGTADCQDAVSCMMGPGNFIVCMAGEPHMPGIAVSENTALRKCVFKVHR